MHHILNNLVWFQFGDFVTIKEGVETVVHGDLTRFFSKDPSAGAFMAGFFPVMMFGLPAACLAMIKTAHTARQKATAGILISMALTSFLTGITEPIEFSFMFLAFPLYILHSVLMGVSMVVMNLLDVKLGFTFSAGLFDYLLSYGYGKNAILLVPVGIVYGLVYYFVFYFAIKCWDLKTPGREDEKPAPSPEETAPAQEQTTPSETAEKKEEPVSAPQTRGEKYLAALGGKNNVKTLDACATRLRVEVTDSALVDTPALKALGARGVVNAAGGIVQVVIGPEADLISDEIKPYLK